MKLGCVQEGELNNESGGKKGSKTIKCTIADDRMWLSIMTCVNACVSSVSNLYIFKRNTKPIINYTKNCEPNVAMSWQENGYMTAEIFLEWLQHFKANVQYMEEYQEIANIYSS